ncbi:RDD family protein [Allostreptomyces psammosilenae]|uniref:Putative RDD family membrane protein YckC n=1 Tax=Allostreptomyces psammosilenae TaxID=1892865 RepID=A0A853A991_9ACTN|nr:RDD family protein [Allostreptomyces psammosilenae]NYI06982.1 putative RDD family membrane protein YckC [Allostreptomyces psammosilenae]
MDSRRALGTWISGPQAAAEEMGVDFGYRGERLGLPRSGSGAIAPNGRRIGALFVDWWACSLIATQLISPGDQMTASLWAAGLFLVMSLLLIGTTGLTVGKRLFGLRVIRLDGRRPGPGRVLARTVLLLLVVPAVIWDRDGRGLHDKLAGTVEVRL